MNNREERFLRVLPDLAELPDPFRTALSGSVNEAEIERIILMPRQEYPILRTIFSFQLPFGWRRVPQKVMLAYNRALEIHALKPGGGTDCIRIEYDRLVSLGIGSHLLYAYACFQWSAPQGTQTARIEFNAVGESIMRERLDAIRVLISRVRSDGPAAQEVEETLRDKSIPIKFRNYAVFSLLPGEELLRLAYQPAIRKSGLLAAPLAPDRLFALTDRHFTVIDEDVSVAANYSINTQYFPLANLAGVQIREGVEADEIALTFLKEDGETRVIYPITKGTAQALQEWFPALEAAV